LIDQLALKKTAPSLLIDFLKVCAALLIILHHLSSYGQVAKDAHIVLPLTMGWLFDYGRYAVQIFLVIAGYLAAQSLSRFANMRFSASNLLKVIFNRYLRLFFPYVVALLMTIACAYIARFWINDEFVGESETLSQFLAHLFFIQGILGLDSISAGAWYIAIDWQLYAVLAILLTTFPRYQSVIWILSALGVCSLLFFNRSGDYEAYFIYFIGSYGLGALAFLAKGFNNNGVNRLAKIILVVIGIIILVSSFQQLWLRNILAWMVAVALLLWGDKPYPAMSPGNQKLFSAIAWASPRSYSAFLIHFALILLVNTLYIASNWYQHESGLLAIALMLSVVTLSIIAANYLYRWVELPTAKLKF
jgi:peptidoglycan/LPS O-acetylase OafA/YrhL